MDSCGSRLSPSTPDGPAAASGRPPLPAGQVVDLPGRGELFVRQAGERRPGRPSLVLLHGWTATADLNWFPAYEPLAEQAHVVACDLRGHGRGLRSPQRFSLEDCADDIAALAVELDLGGIVPVGYSMGGLVAQLLWRRHRHAVEGLILCSTSRNFRGTAGDQVFFNGLSRLAGVGRLAPGPLRDQTLSRLVELRTAALGLEPWALEEVAGHDLCALLEAGAAIGEFSSHGWIGEVDVPTAVVITTSDTTVPPDRQRKLAAAIPDARTVEVDADHHACPRRPERFIPALLDAVDHVLGS